MSAELPQVDQGGKFMGTLTPLTEPRWDAIREVNENRGVVAAGARAIEMQIAHPFVAQSIVDAGYFEDDPLRRLRETAQLGMTLIFDSPENAQNAAYAVRNKHLQVNRQPREQRILQEDLGPHYHRGDVYSAHDQEAQKWVAAAIIDSSFVGYETFVGPLSQDKKAGYLREAQELFAYTGLRTPLPQTETELKAYIQGMIDSQKVIAGSAARQLAPKVLLSDAFPGSEVLASYLKLTTLALLPDEIRRQLGLQKLIPAQRKAFELSTAAIRRVTPHLPERIAINPQAREANRRPHVIFDSRIR